MTLELQVDAVSEPCPGYRSVAFTLADGGPPPAYPPGSHLGLEWAPGRWNAYSLTGPSIAPERLHITVALRPRGSGGSRWVHRLRPGDRVRSTMPRNGFAPVETARRHLLVAGGIGVTPVLSHVRWHSFWGNPFSVLYVHRPGAAPHRDELRALCGDRLSTVTGRRAARAEIHRMVTTAPFGSHLYSCGPPGLTAVTERAARDAHWVAARIHSERFDRRREPGRPFRAVLRRSGRTVDVGAGESLLDAVARIGVATPSLCRSGVCGECLTPVGHGAVEHRDTVHAAREGRIALCVSRAAGPTLELDL
ncbi:PDR/VanB family oxidoreductase [Pseudonocardia sp. NPDC049635]|uniref:PDR/VanB family oxidoreductase n=1 Tax=Pseudonocardia sp. NPDC049635 TaxID=3155506 RepID=UPI0033F09269